MDYSQDAKQIVKAVGGKENIQSVAHCATLFTFCLKMMRRRLMKKQLMQLKLQKELFQQMVNIKLLLEQEQSIWFVMKS